MCGKNVFFREAKVASRTLKIHSFIHSFRSLSHERSIASSKASSPHRVKSTASSLNFQYPRRLRLLRLPVTSILSYIFPSTTSFRRHFLRKMWPIQLAFLLFILRRIFLSSLTQYFISHTIGSTDLLSPSATPHFKIFPGIYALIYDRSTFLHHTMAYLICSTSLASPSLPVEILLLFLLPVECCCCHGNPGFNFTCTSCIIFCYVTQTVEISHILPFFLIYHNL